MRNWLGLTRGFACSAATPSPSHRRVGNLATASGRRPLCWRVETTCPGESLPKLSIGTESRFCRPPRSPWRLLLEAGWKGKSEFQAACGGEAMPRDWQRRWRPSCAAFGTSTDHGDHHLVDGYLVRDGKQPVLIGRPGQHAMLYPRRKSPAVPIAWWASYSSGVMAARGYLRTARVDRQKFTSRSVRHKRRTDLSDGRLARTWRTGTSSAWAEPITK